MEFNSSDWEKFFASKLLPIGMTEQGERKPKWVEEVGRRLEKILDYEPVIGIFGQTGVGKSSLCNALFGQDVCKISDVKACTREPQTVLLKLGQNGLKLLDVPGVGENEKRDQEYKELYKKLLPELDLMLWLLKADSRAYGKDEEVFNEIVRPNLKADKDMPFFFVVNQVDKIEPVREWDDIQHRPGDKQLSNIKAKVQVVAEEFQIPESKIIPVSAEEEYELGRLVEEIVYALPKEKAAPFFRSTQESVRTERSKNETRRKWTEVVKEVIAGVLDVAADVVTEKVPELVDKAVAFFRNWFGW